MLSVELLPASAAAGFSPSFRAAAVVTKSFSDTTSTASFYGFSRCTKVPASRCVTSYSEINLFRSLSLFFSSACKRINGCDARFAAAPVRTGLFLALSGESHILSIQLIFGHVAPQQLLLQLQHGVLLHGQALLQSILMRGRERERDGCIKETSTEALI